MKKFSYEAKGLRSPSRNIVITPLGRRILKQLDAGTYRTRKIGRTRKAKR